MIDRIFKNWKTSLVGLILLGSSIAMMWTKVITPEQALLFIPAVFGLFFTKDKSSKKAIVLIIPLFVFGCRTKESLVEKEIITITHHTRDSIYVEIKDTIVEYLPSPEASQSVGLDSSRLSTSLAWSIAIWDGFRLSHVIENNYSITVPVPHYEYIYRYRTDTLYRDREILIDKVVVKEKYRFLNGIFYWLGIASASMLAVYVAFKFLRK